ncbi:MAG: hypothetical protein CMF55_00565 [Legionellales bacterium]|nr:hypothetical protein [Legionellales bacterium]
MTYDEWDYEADKRSEYEADAAWEARQEERMRDCKHEEWFITDEGIIDVESFTSTPHRGSKVWKKVTPMAVLEIECCYCGKTNYGRVPYSEIIKLLRNEFEHTGGLDIDEDGWPQYE